MKLIREKAYKVLLFISLFSTICGLCLLIFSVYSSAWQIVYLRELHVYHQHGVWWDCIKQDGKVYSSSRILKRRSIIFPELKCSHKFDIAAQNALDSAIAEGEVGAKELELHKILPQHKAVLLLAAMTLIFGTFAISLGLLSVCSKICAIFHGTVLFLSASCSGLADLIFLLAAARINIRYVPGIVDIYEQHLGVAVILHATASLILFLSFIISIMSGCVLLSPCSRDKRRYNGRDYCHCQSPQLRSYQKKNALGIVLEAGDEVASDELSESKKDNTSAVSLL